MLILQIIHTEDLDEAYTCCKIRHIEDERPVLSGRGDSLFNPYFIKEYNELTG